MLSNKIHRAVEAQVDNGVYYKIYMSVRDQVWEGHESIRQSIKQKIKKEH
jgi:hypothetical protein